MKFGVSVLILSIPRSVYGYSMYVNRYQMIQKTFRRCRIVKDDTKKLELRASSVDDIEYDNEVLLEGSMNMSPQTSTLSYVENEKRDSFGSVSFPKADVDSWKAVISTALMITGGTIGASALILPQFVAKPGMAVSTSLFLGVYALNLLSGLLIAEVAIKQREQDGNDVPSSFKDFAETNLGSSSASYIISAISLFANTCVCAFDFASAGDILSKSAGGILDSSICLIGFASSLVILRVTHNGEQISRVSSAVVVILILSFFGLLFPGLQNVQSPMETFLKPGTNSDMFSAISEATPIILTTATYQNVIPSVTKILGYDRMKTVIAISVGSFLPICLFMAWSFACIGGGIEQQVGGGDFLYTIFSFAAVIGSSIGCTMAINEEINSIVDIDGDSGNIKDMENSNPLTTIAAVGLPSAAALLFAGGEDFSNALKLAGSYGSPLLYGAVPVVMAWTQRRRIKNSENLVSGGNISILILGAASALFVFNEMVVDLSAISIQQIQ
mmetsp:Transcript_15999/g.17788  ORF Transcript_15999/g.17788 Transcript_15999/m.17788 type:complete len:501 (-) Transcript_15999:240-1742(-)